MTRPYDATLSVAMKILIDDPMFPHGWIEAQIEHIAPSLGARVTRTSVKEDFVACRMEYRVSGEYLDTATPE